jgi:CheY-like chemotaxis protein
MNILLIEDDPMILKLIQFTCDKEGHTIATATNGIEAIECLKNDLFDLIISDEVLPGLRGHEIADWMRQDTRYQQVPLILISAERNPQLFADLATKGIINMFVPKPFSVMQLLSSINMAKLIKLPPRPILGM